MIDEGKLWSLIRSVMQQGVAIHIDHESLGYERYSARLDAAASERVAEFVKLMVLLRQVDVRPSRRAL